MPNKANKLECPWNHRTSDPEHHKMEDRPRSRKEYHTARWTRESKLFRQKHPLCEMCKAKGIITPAEVVDHIIPVDICKDFWDKSNWQSLCRKCNIEKGNRDKALIHGRRSL